MAQPLKPGKLALPFLQKLLTALPSLDRSIVVPPGIGLDAAGIKSNNRLFAVTTDPITLSDTKIGTYSVAVNVNDVACLGCKPRWYLACLLLPVGITKRHINNIWRNLVSELQKYNIQAVGGHTEITPTVTTPILVGQIIGEVIGKTFLTPKNSKPGDQILLWNSIAIEGTALLATKYYNELQKYLTRARLKAMQNLIHDPGICIWPLVDKLLPCQGVVALHDITEGGIATALHELATASNLGLIVNGDAIPVRADTKQLAQILAFNPLGLIGSGSALIICRKRAVPKVRSRIGASNLTVIGELTQDRAKIIVHQGKKRKLSSFSPDEVTAPFIGK